MKATLCNTTINSVINLLRKKKNQQLQREEVENLLNHEDYQFEFRRYGERVSPKEFVDYIMKFETLETEQIENNDLKNHHSCWLDLYANLDWYEKKTEEYFTKFDAAVIEEAYQIAVNGFPKGYKFSDCKVVFTCGIGQSFGYANENGMHFDIMQLFRKYENDNFKSMIAHEIHHLIFMDNIEFQENNLEGYFFSVVCDRGTGN